MFPRDVLRDIAHGAGVPEEHRVPQQAGGAAGEVLQQPPAGERDVHWGARGRHPLRYGPIQLLSAEHVHTQMAIFQVRKGMQFLHDQDCKWGALKCQTAFKLDAKKRKETSPTQCPTEKKNCVFLGHMNALEFPY